MGNLNFEVGLKTFTLNGDENKKITFNPTDPTLARNIYEAFSELSKREEIIKNEIKDEKDTKKVLDVFIDLDNEIKEKIDTLFGAGTSLMVFGQVSSFAMASGMPIWANFILCIIDELSDTIQSENSKTNAKIQQYIAKYKKR